MKTLHDVSRGLYPSTYLTFLTQDHYQDALKLVLQYHKVLIHEFISIEIS